MKVLSKLLNGIRGFFRSKHPRDRQIYAVTGGKYLGEFFVYIEQDIQVVRFLSLPSMEVRNIPKDKFEFGIEKSILEPVEIMSRDVFSVCKTQYNSINN